MATDPIVAPTPTNRCPDCAERLIAANQARCFVCAQQTECDDPGCGCHEALRRRQPLRIAPAREPATKGDSATANTAPGRRTPVPPPSEPPAPRDDELTLLQRRILDVLASLAAIGQPSPRRSSIAALVGSASTRQSFRDALSALVKAGYIMQPTSGTVALTDLGRARSTATEPRTRAELHDAWFSMLSSLQVMMLDLIIDEYPRGIKRARLMALLGYTKETDSFKNALRTMRSLGIIDYYGEYVIATDMLFPEGLR